MGAAGPRATFSSRPSSTSSEPGPASEDSDSPGPPGPPSGHKTVRSTSYTSRLHVLELRSAGSFGLTGTANSGPPAG
eukprot:4500001-Alexandrium_andersonii.AAC.1